MNDYKDIINFVNKKNNIITIEVFNNAKIDFYYIKLYSCQDFV